jgi:hypothetical protein
MIKLNDILESYPEEEFLKADGFDGAIVGIEANSLRLVYSVEIAVEILITRDGMEADDALEYIYYNVIGAYVGDKTPIWINTIL